MLIVAVNACFSSNHEGIHVTLANDVAIEGPSKDVLSCHLTLTRQRVRARLSTQIVDRKCQRRVCEEVDVLVYAIVQDTS